MLGVLNLVPIPPLDGSRVLAGVLPDRFGLTMAPVSYTHLDVYKRQAYSMDQDSFDGASSVLR